MPKPKSSKPSPNPWNVFRAEHAGKSYTLAKLSAMYQAEKLARDSASKAPSQRQKEQKGQKGQEPGLPAVDEYQAPKLPRGAVGVKTKEWTVRKPHTQAERRALMQACGEDCFLIPDDLKYPVCAREDLSCAPDCDGIRAQRNITHLIVNRHTVSRGAKMRALRARTKANELGAAHCGWVKK